MTGAFLFQLVESVYLNSNRLVIDPSLVRNSSM